MCNLTDYISNKKVEIPARVEEIRQFHKSCIEKYNTIPQTMVVDKELYEQVRKYIKDTTGESSNGVLCYGMRLIPKP